jgi:hypothetical protein
MRYFRKSNAILRYMRDKKINKKLQLRIAAYLEYFWAN